MSRLRTESFGRFPLEDVDPRNDEEESERMASAETWILSGGSWKKRKDAAAAKVATKEAPTNSPFRSRLVGKLQPSSPRSSSWNQSSSSSLSFQRPRSTSRASITEISLVSDAHSATSRSSVKSREGSRFSENASRASTVDTKWSCRTEPILSASTRARSANNANKSITNREARDEGPHTFARSSSGLSGISSKASTIDTRRSNRTSQTEPPRASSMNGFSNNNNNNTFASAAPVITVVSPGIPSVVVEEKKKKKAKKSVKPADSWLKEKDDFFSATRHSESVTRVSRSPVNTEGETGKERPSSAPRQRQTNSQLPKEKSSSFIPDKGHRMNVSRSQQSHEEEHSNESGSRKDVNSGWNEEKKEVDMVPEERLDLSLHGVEEIPLSVRAKELRKQRARSITPKARRSPPVDNPQQQQNQNHLSAVQRNARALTPERSGRMRIRSPPPPNPKGDPVSKSNESTTENGNVKATPKNPAGLPLSHVTAIRQCFGFDCDIYKDVLRVGRNATDRQLRIAYFRSGRSVLAEHQQLVQASQDKVSDQALQGLAAETKEKFQAVSLAYEILNRPDWRAAYDKSGWDAPLLDLPTKNRSLAELQVGFDNKSIQVAKQPSKSQRSRTADPRSRSTTPILRSAVGNADERRSRSTGRGIRWSEQVEELVFRQDPEELQARRVRSPIPDPAIFEEDWSSDAFEPIDDAGSFMANFLSDLDHSLDGLEASLDGLMGRGFEDWSLSSKTSGSKDKDKKGRKIDRLSNTSPVSVESQSSSSWDGTDDDYDTLPSKLTDSTQTPTCTSDKTPEGWNPQGSVSSGNPSTIQPEQDSEDLTVKQLFAALTQTKEERKIREEAFEEKRKPESDDRSSPSDVKKLPMADDEVARAFSDVGQEYMNQPSKPQQEDIFDPFEDSISTLNIKDADFGSPGTGFDEYVPDGRTKSLSTTEDGTSILSPPEIKRTGSKQSAPQAIPPQNDTLFSATLPEFQDHDMEGAMSSRIVDTTSFRHVGSEFSSITGTHSSVFNMSVKTEHVFYEQGASTFCAPMKKKLIAGNKSASPKAFEMRQEAPGQAPPPCNTDFLSHLFCYTNALSTDLASFGNEFSTKLTETRNMILESLTFTDEDVNEVVSAMDMPGVERSNTM